MKHSVEVDLIASLYNRITTLLPVKHRDIKREAHIRHTDCLETCMHLQYSDFLLTFLCTLTASSCYWWQQNRKQKPCTYVATGLVFWLQPGTENYLVCAVCQYVVSRVHAKEYLQYPYIAVSHSPLIFLFTTDNDVISYLDQASK